MKLSRDILFFAATPSLMKLSQSFVMFAQELSPEAAGKAAVVSTALMMNPEFAQLRPGAPVSFVIMEQGKQGLIHGFTAYRRNDAANAQAPSFFGLPAVCTLPDGRVFFSGDPSPEKQLISRIPGGIFPKEQQLSCICSPGKLYNNDLFIKTASSILFRNNAGGNSERELAFICREIDFLSAGISFPEQNELLLDFSLSPKRNSGFAAGLAAKIPECRTAFSGFSSADTWIRMDLPDSETLRSFLRFFPREELAVRLISMASGRVLISQKTSDLLHYRLKIEAALRPGTPELPAISGLNTMIRKAEGNLYRAVFPEYAENPLELYLEKKGNILVLAGGPGLSAAEASKMIASSGKLPVFPAGKYVCAFRKRSGKYVKYMQIGPENGTLKGILRIKSTDFPKMQ